MENLIIIFPAQVQRHRKKKNTQTNEQIEVICFALQFMANIMAHKKMTAHLLENKKIIHYKEGFDGNISKYDEYFLRKLQVQMLSDTTILLMQIQIIQPHLNILNSCKKLDPIFNYVLSQINQNYQDIIFYTENGSIMVKNLVFLPDIKKLILMQKEKLNQLIQKIHVIYDDIEKRIMQKKDKLLSLQQLDVFQIEMFFKEHLILLNQFKNDNYIPEIVFQQKTQIVFIRQCEFFNEQISIDNEKHINKQSLTQIELKIISNIENPVLKQQQYSVKLYYLEIKLDPNQQSPNIQKQLLEGSLLQEFHQNFSSEETNSQQKKYFDQMYFPQEDPMQKNVLKEQLPQIEISVIKKLYVLKDVILYIQEQLKLLQKSNFKGKLSVLLMIRFCDDLGFRPVLILQKKEKKHIDIEENRKFCNKIIQNFINLLFFQNKNRQKVEPIDDICGEFLRNLQYTQLEHFPNYVVKLEKLILLINQLYSVNF
ncbi:unnamed protein product [Paramecium sonneborni]|uniref:Uncharacterized protein n=1 Tax=Paramecium sonneborni TaxID=65129 RepID=A0A8S1MQX8_9CILI|nr:unnamed protein product [Paramecium sonneborni]